MSIKNRFITIALLLTIALMGWFALAFRPAQSRLNELNSSVGLTREQVTSLQAQLERLTGLKRNEGNVRAEAARMTKALPADPSMSDFILQVQDAANSAGIDFLSIAPSLPAVPVDAAAAAPVPGTTPATPQPSSTPSADGASTTPTAPTTPLRTISIQLDVEGKFFEIEQFILKLEHLARALRIDDFTLSAGAQGSQGPDGAKAAGAVVPDRLTSSMKLQMFMLAPQAAAGSGAVPGQAQNPGGS